MADETVLIVEDNELNRKLVETVLRPHGYHLLFAEDGEVAIRIAAIEKPDLILMDMRLPKTDGYETTHALKAQPETAHIPIVAMTAYAMSEEQEKAQAAGCDGYITKPIDTRALPGQVREYLHRPDVRGESEAQTQDPTPSPASLLP